LIQATCSVRANACCITQLSASSRRITQDEYDKKARELKQRQAEIALRIEQHQEGDGHFRATLESLISLASRAAELFERSKIEQKRELIAFVFSNLRLRGKTLEFSLRSPFDLMVNLQGHSVGWGTWIRTKTGGVRVRPAPLMRKGFFQTKPKTVSKSINGLASIFKPGKTSQNTEEAAGPVWGLLL
jgi:hypothetical protein